MYDSFHLLNPESDLHLISLYIITAASQIKVMRIKEMITHLRWSELLNTFSLSALQEIYREQFGEMYIDVRV